MIESKQHLIYKGYPHGVWFQLPKKKPIHSKSLITVNINQQYRDDENLQNDVEVFDEIINELLDNIDQYIKLPGGVVFDEPHIKDISVHYVIEVGDIKKQIHTHVMVKIMHFTKVQLNYITMKQDIKEALWHGHLALDYQRAHSGSSTQVLRVLYFGYFTWMYEWLRPTISNTNYVFSDHQRSNTTRVVPRKPPQ